MPQAARLHHSRDFARIYRHGRSGKGKLLRLSWQASRLPHARIAVVTNRKLSTKAVRRNLLKRQVRGLTREYLERLQPMDIIIHILPQPLEQFHYEALRAELEQLLTQHHLIQA